MAVVHAFHMPFEKLKLALVAAPVLATYDPAAPFDLITDSCGCGIGAMLMQQGKPVTFYSRKQIDPERNYVNHEQGTASSIFCIQGMLLLPAWQSLQPNN